MTALAVRWVKKEREKGGVEVIEGEKGNKKFKRTSFRDWLISQTFIASSNPFLLQQVNNHTASISIYYTRSVCPPNQELGI